MADAVPVFFDGEYYDDPSDVPDLGSWEATCAPYYVHGAVSWVV